MTALFLAITTPLFGSPRGAHYLEIRTTPKSHNYLLRSKKFGSQRAAKAEAQRIFGDLVWQTDQAPQPRTLAIAKLTLISDDDLEPLDMPGLEPRP